MPWTCGGELLLGEAEEEPTSCSLDHLAAHGASRGGDGDVVCPARGVVRCAWRFGVKLLCGCASIGVMRCHMAGRYLSVRAATDRVHVMGLIVGSASLEARAWKAVACLRFCTP